MLPTIRYEFTWKFYGETRLVMWEHAAHVVLPWDYEWLKMIQSWVPRS